jgi:hypothetical protein
VEASISARGGSASSTLNSRLLQKLLVQQARLHLLHPPRRNPGVVGGASGGDLRNHIVSDGSAGRANRTRGDDANHSATRDDSGSSNWDHSSFGRSDSSGDAGRWGRSSSAGGFSGGGGGGFRGGFRR